MRGAKVWVPLLKNMQNSVNFKDAGLNTATESGDWITYEIHIALIMVLCVLRPSSVLVSWSLNMSVGEVFVVIIIRNLIFTLNIYNMLYWLSIRSRWVFFLAFSWSEKKVDHCAFLGNCPSTPPEMYNDPGRQYPPISTETFYILT